MQTPDPQSFFIPIKKDEERNSIFGELSSQGYEVKIKFLHKGSPVFLIRPIKYEAHFSTLTCRILGSIKLSPKENEAVVQFSLGDKLYISQCPFKFYDDQLALETTGKLFRVQRRESFRVYLPKEFQGKLRLDLLDGQIHNRIYNLVDLSGGGCRFESQIQGISIKSGQSWSGNLIIPDRPQISLHGKIKHIAAHPTSHNAQWVGTAFDNLNVVTRNELEGIVMDLYRTFFTHL